MLSSLLSPLFTYALNKSNKLFVPSILRTSHFAKAFKTVPFPKDLRLRSRYRPTRMEGWSKRKFRGGI
jgi:hypothetical protein